MIKLENNSYKQNEKGNEIYISPDKNKISSLKKVNSSSLNQIRNRSNKSIQRQDSKCSNISPYKMPKFVCRATSISPRKLMKSEKYSLKKTIKKNNKKEKEKEKEKNSNNNFEIYSDYKSEYTKTSNLEFFINNNEKNSEFHLKDNTITTTKYNLFTFIPKGLLIQFSRLPNLYFLFITIIQSIPLISPLNALTAIIPLIFVLGVSMIREFIEDLARHKFDKISNTEKVVVLRDGKFKISQSNTLKNGEIVLIYENEPIPADLVLLDSGMGDGQCYVETSSLDGEKTLKLKIANKKLAGFVSKRIKDNSDKNKNIHKIKNLINFNITGYIQVIHANSNLNQIDGKLNFFIEENDFIIKEDNFPINIKEFLLKGSILKNTNWIIGVIIYTGMNNKIILNSRKPRMKISHIEIKMNYYLIFVFCFILICCIICSYFHYYMYKNNINYYNNFIPRDEGIITDCFINFFTYFLLLNTLIPISLIVTIEIVKMAQGLFIHWDTELYSKEKHCLCNAKTFSINEELGKVKIIFSDKTGTLTENKLSFKYCIIGRQLYKTFESNTDFKKRTSQIANMSDYQLKINKFQTSSKKIDEGFLINYILKSKEKIEDCEDNGKVKILIRTFYDKKKLEEEIDYINEFLIALALANECMVDTVHTESTDDIKYLASSPDDLELVKFAAKQGYQLQKTSFDEKVILIGQKSCKFQILHSLNFSSERKRMSIIVKDMNNNIKIYIKGADMEISKRLSKKSRYSENYKNTLRDMELISNLGYRTLMVAYRKISEKEYLKWKEKFHFDDFKDGRSIKIIEKSYEAIEQNFELLGATIVEDKLQDEVPETIKELRAAQIKFWVLTGDKMNTALNIGYSCNLISPEQPIFKLVLDKGNNASINYESNIKINKFFNDFNNYLKKLAIKYNVVQENTVQKVMNKNSTLEIVENLSNSESYSDENLNIALYKLLEKKEYQELYNVIVEAPILIYLFQDEYLTEKFLSICYNSNTVLCCRVSPFQKSQIIKKMKQFEPRCVTLAIGDGGNDVSMITEANVGVGLVGEEGLSAAEASDFSIGEFKLLKRLLFYHGRTNLIRLSKMILYFFYKNIVFTIIQLFFGPFCLLSGQTIIDDWYITCYNLIFTAVPLCISALTDIDISDKDMKKKGKNLAFLYKENRDDKILFSKKNFFMMFIKSVIISFTIFMICKDIEILGKKGDIPDLWFISLLYYISILFVVTNNLFLRTHYIVNPLIISVLITTFLFLIIFLIFVHYGLIFDFNSKATILPSVQNLSFYAYLFFLLGFNFTLDYALKISKFFFGKKSSKLFRLKSLAIQKKNQKQNNRTKSFANHEVSRMNLIKKNSFKKGFNEVEFSFLNKNSLSKLSKIKRNSKAQSIKIYKIKKENIEQND